MFFGALSGSIEHIRANKLRGLAVTTPSRLPALPNTPSVSEFVPSYEASGWNGIGAPRALPAAIVERLNKEINAGLSDATIQGRLANLGVPVMLGSPAEFSRLIADEVEKWSKVVKFAGIKSD